MENEKHEQQEGAGPVTGENNSKMNLLSALVNALHTCNAENHAGATYEDVFACIQRTGLYDFRNSKTPHASLSNRAQVVIGRALDVLGESKVPIHINRPDKSVRLILGNLSQEEWAALKVSPPPPEITWEIPVDATGAVGQSGGERAESPAKRIREEKEPGSRKSAKGGRRKLQHQQEQQMEQDPPRSPSPTAGPAAPARKSSHTETPCLDEGGIPSEQPQCHHPLKLTADVCLADAVWDLALRVRKVGRLKRTHVENMQQIRHELFRKLSIARARLRDARARREEVARSNVARTPAKAEDPGCAARALKQACAP